MSLRFLLAAAGEVTPSDIDLASTAQGYIIGFNVNIAEDVRASAKAKGVVIESYTVIYELLDEVRTRLAALCRWANV